MNTTHSVNITLLKTTLLAGVTLLSACGGGASVNDPSAKPPTVDSFVGNWYVSCVATPGVWRLAEPDAKGYRAPLPTTADTTLNISKTAQADTLEVLVTYNIYPNDSCSGPAAFKFLAATKDNTGAYTGSPEAGAVSVNQGPQIWKYVGAGEANDPRPEGTLKLNFSKFEATLPKQYFGKADWPNETAALGHIMGNWAFPQGIASNQYTVATLANQAAVDRNGQATGTIETLLTTGSSNILPPINPGSWDQAITLLFSSYVPGWGYRKLPN